MARPPGPTGKPRPPGTGRKKGSLDKAARTLVTAEMAKDILDVYRLLGGVAFLHSWAVDNPSAFVNGPLARLMPAPPKADGEDDTLVNINIGAGVDADIEVGRRIAFALAKAAHLQGEAVAAAHEIPYSRLAEQPLPTRPSWMPTEDQGDA